MGEYHISHDSLRSLLKKEFVINMYFLEKTSFCKFSWLSLYNYLPVLFDSAIK